MKILKLNLPTITTIRKVKRCSTQVFHKRAQIYDSSLLKTFISMSADLSTELLLKHDYVIHDPSHFIEQHLLTYIVANSMYFVLDCVNEFKTCDENCDI